MRLESETNKAAAVWENHTHEIVKHPSPVGQLLKQEFGKLSRLWTLLPWQTHTQQVSHTELLEQGQSTECVLFRRLLLWWKVKDKQPRTCCAWAYFPPLSFFKRRIKVNLSIELHLIWQPVSLTETFCDMGCSANLVQLNILKSHICTLIVHKKQICA